MFIYEKPITDESIKEIEEKLRFYMNENIDKAELQFNGNCARLEYESLAAIYFDDFELNKDEITLFLNEEEVANILFFKELNNTLFRVEEDRNSDGSLYHYHLHIDVCPS